MDNWQWPQWVVASIYFIRIIVNGCNNGEPRKSDNNYDFSISLIAVAVSAFVLYKGGFWK